MGVSANGNAIFVASSFCMPDSLFFSFPWTDSSSGFSCVGSFSGFVCASGAGVEGSFSLALRFFTCTGGGSATIDSPLFLALLLRFSDFGSLSFGAVLGASIGFLRVFLGGAVLGSSSIAPGIGSGSFGTAAAFSFLPRVRVNGNPSDSSS